MDLKFREAKKEDTALISSLAEKIWRAHYPAIITVAQIDYMLKNRYSGTAILDGMQRGERYFLAFIGDTPIAYASIEPKDDFYFLHKLYVDATQHKKGIGEKFFQYLLLHTDSKAIRLQVNRQNYTAINFYFKTGFVIESTGDFDIGGGYVMNDFVMLRKAR